MEGAASNPVTAIFLQLRAQFCLRCSALKERMYNYLVCNFHFTVFFLQELKTQSEWNNFMPGNIIDAIDGWRKRQKRPTSVDLNYVISFSDSPTIHFYSKVLFFCHQFGYKMFKCLKIANWKFANFNIVDLLWKVLIGNDFDWVIGMFMMLSMNWKDCRRNENCPHVNESWVN